MHACTVSAGASSPAHWMCKPNARAVRILQSSVTIAVISVRENRCATMALCAIHTNPQRWRYYNQLFGLCYTYHALSRYGDRSVRSRISVFLKRFVWALKQHCTRELESHGAAFQYSLVFLNVLNLVFVFSIKRV